jgi:DNA-binding IclR family transcriptional regulator
MPPEADGAPSYDAPAARLALMLVEVLCASDQPLGVAELARRLGSNPNMTFRLLRTLEDAGWILRRDDAKYEMGLRAFHFTSMPVGRMSLRRAADTPLRRLWEAFGESTYLGVVDGTRTLFLEHLDATGDIRLSARPGGRYRMHCAAPGKVLLAFSNPELADQVAAEGLDAQTVHTITTHEALQAELERIRARGYGLDREEYATGLICFAAPVFGVDDRLVGTIGVSVLTLRWSLERLCGELGPQVIAAANATSAGLGSSRRIDATPTCEA